MDTDLFVICVSAFIAVFALLSFLAVAMRLLIIIYPENVAARADAAFIAALTSAMAITYPGTKVTKIEEMR